MARRISWINNSSGHLGTYVYRAPTLDPQNLPAPVATVDPVVQGATAEWVDNSGEYGCFAVQDFDGQGVSALSSEVCVSDPWAGVQIGDSVEGGLYAGTIMYSDGREFHIIAADDSGANMDVSWGPGNDTPADDMDDGLANQESILALGGGQAFDHCANFTSGGNSDWYLPAQNELILVMNNLASHPDVVANNTWHCSSTESSATECYACRFGTLSTASNLTKTTTGKIARPIRRVAV